MAQWEESVRCGVCAQPIGLAEARTCGVCESAHHPDCWLYNQGCSIYACAAAPAVQRARAAGSIAGKSRGVLFWLVAVALVMMVATQARTASRPAGLRPELLGMFDGFRLFTLSGEWIDFEPWRNSRVSVISVFRVGCPRCKVDQANLVKLSHAMTMRNDIAFMSAAYQGDMRSTAAFQRDAGLRGLVCIDSEGSVLRSAGGRCSTLIVDKRGHVRHRGGPNPAEVERVLGWLAAEP